ERQPVGRQVVDRANQSVGEMVAWLGPIGLRPGQTVGEANAVLDEIFGPDGEATRQELLKGLEGLNAQFNCHGVELGQRYARSAAGGARGGGRWRPLRPSRRTRGIPSSTTARRRIPGACCRTHGWCAAPRTFRRSTSPRTTASRCSPV